jgi:hypothetical protein
MPSLSWCRAGRVRVPSSDLLIAACLIALDAAARLLPHAPDFTPVAATALFAASVLRSRVLALFVPALGLFAGDAMLGFYDLPIMAAVYAALTLPAGAAFLPQRLRRARLIAPLLVSSSLTFFVITNFAVWAFSPIYAANAGGLLKCTIAALPFLRNMLAGDLFWGLALFGGYWVAQSMRAASADAPAAAAVRG